MYSYDNKKDKLLDIEIETLKNTVMKKIFSFLCISLMATAVVSAQERFVSETAQNRKALLEEYTGIHCGYCPDGHARANALLEKYPDDLFIMNIHAGGYATPAAGEVDLRTPYGEALASNSGLSGYPAGSVSRHIFSGNVTATDRGAWATNVPKILAMPSYVNIAAKGTLDWKTRELTVKVQLYYTGSAEVASNFVHVAITQDNIVGTQSNYGNYNPSQILPGGKYVHHHAFRDFLTGQWGEEVSSVAEGDFVEKTYTKVLPEIIGNVDLELIDLHVLAFVTETRNEVVNACNVQVEHLNGPDYYVKLGDLSQVLDNSCDMDVRMSVKLENKIAAEPITSLTFRYETPDGEGEFTYEPEEPMVAGLNYTLTTAPIAISSRNKEKNIALQVVKINGKEYENGNVVEASAVKTMGISATSDIVINIWQDKYGTDITWQLKEIESATVLASGGPYPDLSGTSNTKQQTANATLADGCYVFAIYDKNKDGINTSYGAGHLSVDDAEGKVVFEHDGKYKDSLRFLVKFDPDFVSNQKENEVFQAVLLPNPASEYSVLKVDMPAVKKVHVRLMAVNGSCVLDLGKSTLNAGLQEIMLPVKNLSEGMYFVTVQGDGVNLTRKLLVIR